MEFELEKIEKIRNYLAENKQTIAVAESVTAGFLQAALATATRASDFFEGGLTAYNIDQKVRHLAIDRELGEMCNCVSQEIATQMATGATKLFSSTWGIAATGYATPVEESEFRIYAFYAIARGNKVLESERIDLVDVEGDQAQIAYVNRILEAFVRVIGRSSQ